MKHEIGFYVNIGNIEQWLTDSNSKGYVILTGEGIIDSCLNKNAHNNEEAGYCERRQKTSPTFDVKRLRGRAAVIIPT